MKKLLIIPILTFIVFSSAAQVYNMANATISTCGGTFYDAGGASGAYSNIESFTETFCSNLPGSNITITFSSFESESCCDHLYIYDGPNPSGNILIQAEGINPFGLIGTPFTSSTGCLTIKWVSDGSVTANGWVAGISCTFGCQPFSENITNPSEPFFNGDTIHICQNTPLTLHAIGTYGPATNYSQSDNTTTFLWNFGDGSAPVSGIGMTTVTHIWPEGAYYVTLKGTDNNDCNNSNLARIMVIVSNTPIFAGTNITPDTICSGWSVTLDGRHVQNHSWSQIVDTMVAGLTYLPDGQGVPYETSISNNLFLPDQTMNSVTDIVNVCINMEHSYLGDLTIHLICPNGQFLDIFTYSNGLGLPWFGVPIDNDQNTAPGVGWTYCWTPQSTTPVPNMGGQSVPAGNYQSTGPFTDLLNCPMNGQWTIHVEDNLGSDNGYIFWWSMQYNQSIIPPQYTYSNTTDSSTFLWLGSNISSQYNGIANASPTNFGINNFTFQLTDNFDCLYDTTLSVLVRPANNPLCCATTTNNGGNDNLICNLTYHLNAVLAAGTTGTWQTASGAPGTATFNNPHLPTATVNVSHEGNYKFVWVETVDTISCAFVDTVSITFNAPSSDFTISEIQCYGDTLVIQYNGVVSQGSVFNWNFSGASLYSGSGEGPYLLGWPYSGTYPVALTVIKNGCSSQTTHHAVVPASIKLSASIQNNLCFGYCNGSITLTVLGGNPPYSYNWSTGNNIMSDLCNNSYPVTVSDAHTCKKAANYTITSPSEVIVTCSAMNSHCGQSDGMAISNVTGGIQPYLYQWDDSLWQTNSSAGFLPFGTYHVTVTDYNNCVKNSTVLISNIDGPTTSVSFSNSLCFNDSANTWAGVFASGGTQPYTYLWSNGANLSEISEIFAGAYTVTITDSAGCSAVDMAMITQPSEITPEIFVTDVSCTGMSDGSATINVTGGTCPYTYHWSNWSSYSTINYLAPGIYYLTITDANGCYKTTFASINQIQQITIVSSSVVATNCYNSDDGSASVDINGGTSPFSFLWDNGEQIDTAVQLSGGHHTFTVTDDNNCAATGTVFINEPSPINITIATSQLSSPGANDGSIDISVSGGSPPYTYLWSNSDTTEDLINLPAGNYYAIVTDNHGCYIETMANIDFSLSSALNKINSEVSVSPNPADKILKIQNLTLKYYYEIIDPDGKIILKGKNPQAISYINISTISKGLYFLRIVSEEKVIIRKFIKR